MGSDFVLPRQTQALPPLPPDTPVCQPQGTPLSSPSRKLKSEGTHGTSSLPTPPSVRGLGTELADWPRPSDAGSWGRRCRLLSGACVFPGLCSWHVLGHVAWLFQEQCLTGTALAWRDVSLSSKPALPRVFPTCFSADSGTLVPLLFETPCL